jgi:hypothetical protein
MSLASFGRLLIAALAFALAGAVAAQKPDMSGDWSEPFTSFAGERIRSFDSDIAIDADGALHVTETITVHSQGERIIHGILRDFPTDYRRDGRRVRVGFRVESVTRDGAAEEWHIEGLDNGVRVRIGSADTMLLPGDHTYVIGYTTTRQIGYFPNYDELYWNVTGNGWEFPIDQASARVRLPAAVPIAGASIYTGAQGSRESNGEVVSQGPGEISFRTTRPLGLNEGMTIAFNWPKGVVAPLPPPNAFQRFVTEGGGAMGSALLALLGLGGFYYYAWRKAGRGPIPGTVVPLFAPPEGMSAAAVRYVKRMGFDDRCFSASIVQCGVRGKLRIVEEEKSGLFAKAKTRIEKVAEGDDLDPPEREMLKGLFSRGNSVETDKSEYKSFQAAKDGLSGELEKAYKGRYFLSNLGWAFLGMALLLAAMIFVGLVVIAGDQFAESVDRMFPLLGLLGLGGAIALALRSSFALEGGSKLLAALSILLSLAGAAMLIPTIACVIDAGLALPLFTPLLALPLAISAFWWMAAPTREGRAVMDQIAGFERYLSITEEHRLEALHPPEKTPELFERFLPYAIALDVENRWADRFSGVLAAAAQDPNQQRGMTWYSSSQNVWTNPARFTAAMGGALASSVAAAAVAPGSSSGSGGGGFSGGGGGGGGGGGW